MSSLQGSCLCGAVRFRTAQPPTGTSVALGALDGATGLRLQRHIFVADKGDCYDLADGLPQNPS